MTGRGLIVLEKGDAAGPGIGVKIRPTNRSRVSARLDPPKRTPFPKTPFTRSVADLDLGRPAGFTRP